MQKITYGREILSSCWSRPFDTFQNIRVNRKPVGFVENRVVGLNDVRRWWLVVDSDLAGPGYDFSELEKLIGGEVLDIYGSWWTVRADSEGEFLEKLAIYEKYRAKKN